MTEFTKEEVLAALAVAANEAATRANFLDDPNVIGDKRAVPALDRQAHVLVYAREILAEKWGCW